MSASSHPREGALQFRDLRRRQMARPFMAQQERELCGLFEFLRGVDRAVEIPAGDHRPVIGKKYGGMTPFERAYEIAEGRVAGPQIVDQPDLADAHRRV